MLSLIIAGAFGGYCSHLGYSWKTKEFYCLLFFLVAYSLAVRSGV